MTPPEADVARLARSVGADPLAASLRNRAPLPPFVCMQPGTPVNWQTTVHLAWDERFLHVEALCEDDDAWGRYRRHDDPVWEEEAFEIFLGEDRDPLTSYCEIDVSPLGTIFDARVRNPHGDRREMEVETTWNCPGLCCRVERSTERQNWQARFALPWTSIGFAARPRTLRANFYRIERPRDRVVEFSGWSATLTDPADFHRPARFGLLRLIE
ncbi:MAG: carbohydrate-binding family 9-like protein [Thermoanaerobaculia bacterium]